jgi:ribosome biogenesis GTPase
VSVSASGALGPYGWTERVLALFNDLEGGPLGSSPDIVPARVVRVVRSACLAVTPDGHERPVRPSGERDVPFPAVGDWIAVCDGAVIDVVPRWSELARGDPAGTGVQVLAANMDLVLITAPADRLNLSRLERELAIAWESGAQPLVVLTKADLAGPSTVAELEDRLAGVDIISTSARAETGVTELSERLKPVRTAALMGPSGAGKSTLTNALIGEDRLATGAVRDGDHRGRHTTTSRQLVVVPSGGVLIDTPGLRGLSLASDGGMSQAFPDIESLAARCRFRDCRHDVEPDCAVTTALATGALDPGRFANYRKLNRELAADAGRTDPALRKAELDLWKARTKEGQARARPRSR